MAGGFAAQGLYEELTNPHEHDLVDLLVGWPEKRVATCCTGCDFKITYSKDGKSVS